MPLLNTLEKSLGRFAVPGLIRYVVALNALVFLLAQMNSGFVGLINLDPVAIMHGQVWRLVTWIFIPATDMSLLWIIFYLMFTWWIGDMIESAWGTFRLNLYYLVGYLGVTGAAFAFGQSFGNFALNASLLLAAGTLVPNFQILLFLVIPLKLKWLAILTAILFAINFVGGSWGTRGAILMAFANYLLFFGPAFLRQSRDSRQIAARRAKFELAKASTEETLHRCEVCGRTEVSNPELDFRVAADGHEYCVAHLPKRTA